jgi:tetratricopeptide (TPR) repeat protein
MPSHIYTRLGQWDRSILSNRRSAEAGRKFEAREHLNALWDQRGHALDYLMYAYLQEGRDIEAKHVLDEAAAATAVFPTNSLTNDYALAAIPARYALERGRWADATRLTLRRAPAWPAAEAITHFARAIGAARAGQIPLAAAEIARLDTLRQLLQQSGDRYWATVVDAQRLAATAWLARAQGRNEDAASLAQVAADVEESVEKHPVTPGPLLPARELLGDLLLDLGRPADALRAYEKTLEREPNRARALAGAARAAELANDDAAARKHYAALLKLMDRADATRPEVEQARRYLARP